jgi:predicted Zn-ribbon and HTH transcriptional regulator
VCAKCWKSYVDDLQKLFHLLPQLERVSRREEHVGGRQQGHASPAFASAPMDLPALDLLTEASETLEEVAGHANLWAHQWRQVVKKLITHRPQVTQSLSLIEDRKRISRLASKVELRLTPPQDRLTIGECLNPDCGAVLNAVKDQQEAQCPQCKSVWQVEAVRAKRREKLSDHTLEASQSEASRWLKRTTGVYVEAHIITMWLQRRMLPRTKKLSKGRYEFNLGELLVLAESFKPRAGLH